jgi:hypothetical protein
MDNQKRLLLLAKHPHVNDWQVQQTLQKQKRQQEAAVATRKAHQLRQQQQQQKEMEQQRLAKHRHQRTTLAVSTSPRYSNGTNLTENSSSDEEEIDEEALQIVFQSARAAGQSSPPEKDDTDDAASFVVWQSAGQGSGEGSYRTPQRISFRDRELPPPSNTAGPGEQRVYTNKKPGIFGWAVATFSKVFPNDSTEPSSGASILSESMDGRSVNTTANKSLASKASLPSCSSAQTRKINNLSSKSLESRNNKMNSIHEDEDDDGHGIFRFVSTRNGLIICVLILILIIAVIVTVGAALRGQEGSTDMIESQAPAPGISIPTMPPALAPFSGDTIVPTISIGQVETLLPTEILQSAPTVQPTLLPTASPTMAPTLSPSDAPTTTAFADWTWIQRGLSLQGGGTSERYGQSLAFSDDGQILAIGAPFATVDGKSQAGLVEIFEWDEDDRRGWVPRGVLQGRNAGDQFGSNIAISADGSVLAISEPTYRGRSGDRSGNVRVFIHSPFNGYSKLGQELEGVDATDHFGIGLSISADGKRLAVGAPYHDNTLGQGNGNGSGNNRLVSGHVRVFEWSTSDGAWQPIGEPLIGESHLDWFGWSVDLNQDGSIVCVGAPRNLSYGGYVQCFEETDSTSVNREWMMVGTTINNALLPARYDDNFGTSVKVSWDPLYSRHRVAVGCPGKNKDGVDTGVGIIYEFDPQKASRGWMQLGQAVDSPNPTQSNQFGSALDLQGDLLAVGAPGAAHVNLYRFENESGEWKLHPRTLQGVAGSQFGAAVRVTSFGDVVVGSPQASNSVGVVNVYDVSRTSNR